MFSTTFGRGYTFQVRVKKEVVREHEQDEQVNMPRALTRQAYGGQPVTKNASVEEGLQTAYFRQRMN